MKKSERLNEKDINERITSLKMEILKQTLKRKGIKKEIARLLTLKNKLKQEGKK